MKAGQNGGAAFPTIAENWRGESRTECVGMSLRDYFAAKAMQAQVITDMVPGEACDALVESAAYANQEPVYRLALNSYHIADAMLKAREA